MVVARMVTAAPPIVAHRAVKDSVVAQAAAPLTGLVPRKGSVQSDVTSTAAVLHNLRKGDLPRVDPQRDDQLAAATQAHVLVATVLVVAATADRAASAVAAPLAADSVAHAVAQVRLAVVDSVVDASHLARAALSRLFVPPAGYLPPGR